MKRTIQEYKELEQLAYHVYKENQYKKPDNWNSLKFYKNEKMDFMQKYLKILKEMSF